MQKSAFVSEPAILVKRTNNGSQVWSMEKLENKLVDMKEMYHEQQDKGLDWKEPLSAEDPFFESQQNHNLIGVANVFLECLFHDVTLDYHTPIISQQGEVAGRLQVMTFFFLLLLSESFTKFIKCFLRLFAF